MHTKDFRHKITMMTRFADVDMLGHVNNAKYVTYIEEARIFYAKQAWAWDGKPGTLSMILAKTVIEYLLPLEAEQQIDVYTRCSRLGGKSFDLSYLIVRTDDLDQKPVCTAVTTMVAYDYARGTSVTISDAWREQITKYEITPPKMPS